MCSIWIYNTPSILRSLITLFCLIIFGRHITWRSNPVTVWSKTWDYGRFLVLRVRIPPEARMSVSCKCCVLSSRGFCVGLITRSGGPTKFGVSVCHLGNFGKKTQAHQGCRGTMRYGKILWASGFVGCSQVLFQYCLDWLSGTTKQSFTYLLTYSLTYSMQQSPSWEANRFFS